MATNFNIIYNNSGPRTPTGATPNQSVAGLNSVGVYYQQVTPAAQPAPAGNSKAAAVINSNGENIGNARAASNPLPPGITS